jgi:hypothetical protein
MFVLDKTGAIYDGERLTGEIRRIDPKTGKNTSVFTIPDVIGNLTHEQGFFGAFNTGDIHEASLNPSGTTAIRDTTPFNQATSCCRSNPAPTERSTSATAWGSSSWP